MLPGHGARRAARSLVGPAARRRACFVLSFAVLVVAGRATRPEGSELALVWPAAALAVLWTATSWGRPRALVVDMVLLGAVAAAAVAATGAPAWLCVATVVANVSQGLIACAVFGHQRPAGFVLVSLLDLRALALAAVASSIASAGVLATGLWLVGGGDPLPTAGTLLARNAVSTLLLTALALRLTQHGPGSRGLTPRSARELAGILAAAAAAYGVALSTGAPFALVLAVLPLAALAAVRLPTTTATAFAVGNGVAVTLVALLSEVPLVATGPTTRVLVTQAFITVTGCLTLVLALHRDERSALIDQLGESEQRFRLAFTTTPTGLCMLSLDPGSRGLLSDANPAMARFLGRDLVDLVGASLLGHCPEPDDVRLTADLAGAAATGVMAPVERRFTHSDGSVRWGQCAGSVVRPAGAAPYLMLLVSDVTARRDTEQALRHQAAHDALTGLPNRTLLLERLELAAAGPQGVGVLFLDLDGFKAVNDRAGHGVGDLLLQQVAARLLGAVRPDDTASRLGGDEFAVVCPGLGPVELAHLAERVASAVARPYVLQGDTFHVSVSTGTALSDGDAPAEELLRRADAAMYVTKRSRRSLTLVAALPGRAGATGHGAPSPQAAPL